MVITHPLVSRTGRTVGVVAGELDLQTLGTIMIERNGLGESGETYLVSGENNYLLTPSRFAGYPPMQAYHSVGIDRALHGENGAGTYSDYRSPPVLVLGVYRWMPELQAALVAEVDIAEALAPAHDTRNTSIALTAIVTLLAALLGFYQAARLSHPIVALTEVATEIGRGRLDQRARVDQRNEIGILATVFNQMTGQLQEMQAGLEQRIAERTAELEHTLAELQSLTSKLEQRNHELQASLVERQKAEAAIRQLNADLERRVAERTADLSAANTDLARAARLKDEFLASTSHELRTPLTAVLGFSEALVEEIYGDLTVKQREALQAITESGKHLLGMINDILDLAKIGAGKLELTFEPVELAAIVQASLRLTSPMARKKKLHVVSSIDSSVSVLYTDTRCLKQILVNLLSNAVKFTPVGGAVGLDIVGDAARRVVHCTVWDTGIGIAQADQAQIFQPFVQIDGRLSRQYAGTGLGLALVARMVNLLGGSITVSSIVGEGSRFTLTLPWNETAEARREMTDVPTGVREHAGPPDPPARQ